MPAYWPISNRLTKVISAYNKQLFLPPGPHLVHTLIMNNLVIFVNTFLKYL